jgi:hypothetical protein
VVHSAAGESAIILKNIVAALLPVSGDLQTQRSFSPPLPSGFLSCHHSVKIFLRHINDPSYHSGALIGLHFSQFSPLCIFPCNVVTCQINFEGRYSALRVTKWYLCRSVAENLFGLIMRPAHAPAEFNFFALRHLTDASIQLSRCIGSCSKCYSLLSTIIYRKGQSLQGLQRSIWSL